MEQLKNVLIIEDEKRLRDRYQQELVWKVNVVFAWNLKTAEEMVRTRVWDIISFDLFLIYEEDNSDWHDTIDLITETKASWFNWHMIAASNEEANRKEQMKAWCTVMVEDKKKLVDLILSLI